MGVGGEDASFIGQLLAVDAGIALLSNVVHPHFGR